MKTNASSPFLDLRLGDCMDLMRDTPDDYYDLALVDPPYGIARFQQTRNSKQRGVGSYCSSGEATDWDVKPDAEYFRELFRVSANQIIWGANNFTLPPSEYFCIWNKHQTVANFASAEYAWVSMGLKMPAKVFSYSIAQHNSDKGKIHPTQKPVALYKWLLSNYAKPGQRILDTHMGSGSIAIACHYFGAHLTATEIDEDYYQAAIERIENETAQGDFLTPMS